MKIISFFLSLAFAGSTLAQNSLDLLKGQSFKFRYSIPLETIARNDGNLGAMIQSKSDFQLFIDRQRRTNPEQFSSLEDMKQYSLLAEEDDLLFQRVDPQFDSGHSCTIKRMSPDKAVKSTIQGGHEGRVWRVADIDQKIIGTKIRITILGELSHRKLNLNLVNESSQVISISCNDSCFSRPSDLVHLSNKCEAEKISDTAYEILRSLGVAPPANEGGNTGKSKLTHLPIPDLTISPGGAK